MSDSESDWSDCPELEETDETTASLLDPTHVTTVAKCLEHDKLHHGWNLGEFGRASDFDILDYIKCVNFMRAKSDQMPMSRAALEGYRLEWQKETYLKPVIESDPFLCYDWDSFVQNDDIKMHTVPSKTTELTEQQIKEEMSKLGDITGVMKDDDYFNSYSDYSIHAEMLQDRVRTEAYRDTIYKNEDKIKGKIVGDVGSGTGILSMFAAKTGATHVYSFEMAEIAYDSMDIIRENGLEGKISVLKGKAEEQQVEQVDVLISEWMGYCLHFEGMLDSVITVRDKLLKPNGLMIPARANMEMCLMTNEQLWQYYNGFWGDVYGFKMNIMKKRTKGEGQVTAFSEKHVASELVELISWDLKTCSIGDLSYTTPIELIASIDGIIHGVIVSFDCAMIDTKTPIVLSTSPLAPTTHWKQTGFLFEHGVKAAKGDVFTGVFKLDRNFRNRRELKCHLKLAKCNDEKSVVCDQEYLVA